MSSTLIIVKRNNKAIFVAYKSPQKPFRIFKNNHILDDKWNNKKSVNSFIREIKESKTLDIDIKTATNPKNNQKLRKLAQYYKRSDERNRKKRKKVRNVVCPYCKTVFKAKDKRARFCSQKCISAYAYEQNKEFLKAKNRVKQKILNSTTRIRAFNNNKRWSDKDIDFLIKNANTMKKTDIAITLGRTYASVKDKLREIKSK